MKRFTKVPRTSRCVKGLKSKDMLQIKRSQLEDLLTVMEWMYYMAKKFVKRGTTQSDKLKLFRQVEFQVAHIQWRLPCTHAIRVNPVVIRGPMTEAILVTTKNGKRTERTISIQEALEMKKRGEL